MAFKALSSWFLTPLVLFPLRPFGREKILETLQTQRDGESFKGPSSEQGSISYNSAGLPAQTQNMLFESAAYHVVLSSVLDLGDM